MFVSILVHEFGHALAFRRFGTDSHIVLWMFGGLAVPYSAVTGRWRRISSRWPGRSPGFMLCGVVYGSNKLRLGRLANGVHDPVSLLPGSSW